MAGLYDDLPEPVLAAAPAEASGQALPLSQSFGAGLPAESRPAPTAVSRLFTLDDASVHMTLGFLSLSDIGTVPSVCKLLQWLRESWLQWRRFIAPLRREVHVHVARLLGAESQSIEKLISLAADIEAAAINGFRRKGHAYLLGGVGGFSYSYGALPLQRVLWSLHSEGLTAWRGVCSMAVDGSFALLPPWGFERRRALLPEEVRLLVGISLWLPPEGAEAEHSYPLLYLNAALQEASAFEALAAQHEDNPPCVAATCEAVLFRPGGGASAVVEEWSLRFCFGPVGFRHQGHGDTDGYRVEAYAAGRRRWRPPDLCYAPDGELSRDAGLHLILRARRCDGLLD